MFSLLEQHKDGSWWYHPGFTFETKEEVEECFLRVFRLDPKRPHKCFEHEEPMFQEHSTSTFDFKTFDFGGMVLWPESRKGEPLRRECNEKRRYDKPKYPRGC